MIQRKKSGSIICPSCGKLISANSKQCIYCGRKNPGLWGYGPQLQKILDNFSETTPILVGACVVLYVISLLIDPAALLRPHGLFNILSPSMKALDDIGMTGTYALAHGRWWTLVTAIYLHGGLLHILFNMLWLYQLGQMVENLVGRSRTFLVFTISGVLGFFVSDMLGITFTIGASGSIFGLLGALVYYGRKRGGFFGKQIYKQMGTWAIVLFLFGFMMPGVNNFAHAGGFIGGYISAQLLGFNEISRETETHRMLALAAVALTVISFILEFVM